MVHQEADAVPVRAAAEAMVKPLRVVDGKGRRLFLMKRAAALEFPAGARQLRPLPDNIGPLDAGAQFFNKGLRERHNESFR